MKKIEEREKLLDDLAFNLNVSVSDIKEALKDLTELNLKILDAQRHIIQRNVEKGLLPNFSYSNMYNPAIPVKSKLVVGAGVSNINFSVFNSSIKYEF